MLTDYHVHLRPDDADATADDHFTTENVGRYLAAARERGIAELGVSEHIHRFTDALSIWDHEFWRQSATDDLAAYCEFVAATPLRLGIEMDWVPGRAEQIAAVLDAHEFDYVIGSVHFVGDGAVDHPDFDLWSFDADPDRVWARYFETTADLVRSGLYDILAHPDLIKYWGNRRPQPTGDRRRFYAPLLEALADARAAGRPIAVEISTAGYRKPIGELYPADELGLACADAGASFALSSDAHVPDDVGRDYDRAIERMRAWGVEELTVFEDREARLEPLG